jgi:hypothetical protein
MIQIKPPDRIYNHDHPKMNDHDLIDQSAKCIAKAPLVPYIPLPQERTRVHPVLRTILVYTPKHLFACIGLFKC